MSAPSQGCLSWLSNVLSRQRLETYRRYAGEEERAFDLYLWNMEISSGFMIPLHVFEVSLRNAVAEAIAACHDDWPWNEGFHLSLPNSDHSSYSPYRDLLAAIEPRKKNNHGDVIVELKFIFWQNMLTRRHHERIWEPNFQRVFPSAPICSPVGTQLKSLHKGVNEIRDFRNRVAHHEPIFDMPFEKYRAQIHNFVGWRSSDAAEWLRGIDPVPELLNKRPRWLDGKISGDG